MFATVATEGIIFLVADKAFQQRLPLFATEGIIFSG
jgi:hypothetical protein